MTIAEMFNRQRELSDELEILERDILSAGGWEYNCEINSCWYWKKEIDGKLVYLPQSVALDHVEMGLPEGEPW